MTEQNSNHEESAAQHNTDEKASPALPSSYPEAQSPLILRASRLIEAFAKSDDERDFYLDRVEGFIIFVDLDKAEESLEALENELTTHANRYCLIPKLSFYETKKIMESFVNEKVYDIDTKEKLIDIIDSKDARENFLEFIYDQHSELEKWQQFYQERSRIRIIEWLRNNGFLFVFEEDLEFNVKMVEKLKESMFETKTGKEIQNTRKMLTIKAKTYYSSEALNPRPKRGRPPKQQIKQEIEQTTSADIYITAPPAVRLYLFIPDLSGVSAATFSAKFGIEEELLKERGTLTKHYESEQLGDFNKKLASLRTLSARWVADEKKGSPAKSATQEMTKAATQKETTKAQKSPAKPLKAKESTSKEKNESADHKMQRLATKKTATPQKESSKESKKPLSRKRIIPQDGDGTSAKKPLRKIIPKSSG